MAPDSASALWLSRLSANRISWARAVAGIPLAVLVLLPDETFRLLAVALFVPAALSDWADGYLARRQNQVSLYGAWLDPVADKILVAAVLIALLGSGEIHGIHSLAVVIILLREIYITALRAYTGDASAECNDIARNPAPCRITLSKMENRFAVCVFVLFADCSAVCLAWRRRGCAVG